jgi:predicted dehydrogenase
MAPHAGVPINESNRLVSELGRGVENGGEARVRVGVVGGGLIAQTIHLPYLSELGRWFSVDALAEPSRSVREAVTRRYGIRHGHADYRAMLARGGLDAVVVCSPNGTHADVVLDALDAGLHVFVEKPLCIRLADVDRIVTQRDRARLVVQVGYMKRFDPAVEALFEELPTSTADLRYVSTVTYDPGLPEYFGPADIAVGADVPAAAIERLHRRTAEQVGEAVGSEEPGDVRAFSDTFLGALVHDVNVVHGILGRMGAPLPGAVLDSGCWAGGEGASGLVELPGGARWSMAWLLLQGLHDFRESIDVYAADGVRSLTFPAPYLRQAPTAYQFTSGTPRANAQRTLRSFRESYALELLHFYECVTEGAGCRTPPEQARLDIQLLTDMFRTHLAGRVAPPVAVA